MNICNLWSKVLGVCNDVATDRIFKVELIIEVKI